MGGARRRAPPFPAASRLAPREENRRALTWQALSKTVAHSPGKHCFRQCGPSGHVSGPSWPPVPPLSVILCDCCTANALRAPRVTCVQGPSTFGGPAVTPWILPRAPKQPWPSGLQPDLKGSLWTFEACKQARARGTASRRPPAAALTRPSRRQEAQGGGGRAAGAPPALAPRAAASPAAVRAGGVSVRGRAGGKDHGPPLPTGPGAPAPLALVPIVLAGPRGRLGRSHKLLKGRPAARGAGRGAPRRQRAAAL